MEGGIKNSTELTYPWLNNTKQRHAGNVQRDAGVPVLLLKEEDGLNVRNIRTQLMQII